MKIFINSVLKYTGQLCFLFLFAGLVSSCDDLLDTNNPNTLLEEDLSNPAATVPMVNGSEAVVTRAVGNILAPYAVAADELTWVGSRDAWQQLQFGNLSNPNNEFTDAAFFYVAEARWWADEVISRVEVFQSEGNLLEGGEVALARAYLYGAVIYVTVADMFDDFVVTSFKEEAGMPVGPDKMGNLYDTAIDYLNKAKATSGLSDDLQMAITGMLARAHFTKAVWAKVNPVNTGDPLVSDASADQFATEALTLMSGDARYRLVTNPTTPDVTDGLDIGGEVNDRLEMRISNTYIIPDDNGTKPAALGDGDPSTTVSLLDLIDGIAHPKVFADVVEFTNDNEFPDYTMVSEREMYLILAESALANNNMDGFTEQINNLRGLDGLTAYSGQVDAVDLLNQSRQVNLFLQGRRIADHYRFNDPAPDWKDNTDAISNPGTFFPITITEIRANPNIN